MFLKKRSTLQEVPLVKKFFVLGTIIQLRVFNGDGEKAVDEAVKKLYEIDDKMSVFKDYSEISKININAGEGMQRVSSDTYLVMERAAYYSKLSNGAFNPTIRPVVGLWGFGTENTRVPDNEEIEKVLKLVNYNDIMLNKKESTVGLKKKGQALDVGGIAKGYAADEIKKIFLKNHVKSAVIDLGGNIFVLGKKADGSMWNVGIQNPLSGRGQYIGTLSVSNKSIVTSGDYERYFTREGKKFHHIIDPRNGYPVENGVISTTIISDLSIDGDALSTCAYVLGVNEGMKFIEDIKGVEAVFINESRKVYTTSGIKDKFKLLNEEFVLEKIQIE